MEKYKVLVEHLKSPCDISCFKFKTTAEIYPLQGIIGQKRASESLEFGMEMMKKGYNIYAAGQSGTGRNSYVMSIAEKKAEVRPVPDDWVYVNNFKFQDKPLALNLKSGNGEAFVKDIDQFIIICRREIPKLFIEKSYENKKNILMEEYEVVMEKIVKKLNVVAEKFGFIFTKTDRGLISIPLKDGKPMSEEEFRALATEEIQVLKDKTNELSVETIEIFNELRVLEEELRNNLKELDEEVGLSFVKFHIEQIQLKYNYNECMQNYFNELVEDIVKNIEQFKIGDKKESSGNPMAMFQAKPTGQFYEKYKVNLFINHEETKGAPIVNETNPSYYNLLGRVEYKNEMGVLKTDFSQIKPGSLHQANGGFLILQAKDLLTSPFAWNALKRALKTGEIVIEGLDKQLGYVVTSSLKPQAIPLDIKVIIIGDPYTYHILYTYDEDFKKLFKIMADFDVEMIKNEQNIHKMARFIATHCEKEGLKHFDNKAVGRLIEYSCRLADNQEKLSSQFNQLVEILYESDKWASEMKDNIIQVEHIEKAIEAKIYRNNKYEEKLLELFEDGTLLLEVEGERVGEINGLAVTGTGDYSFGKPSKITVTTYRGRAGIVNIEREVNKSGSIHDKGVMILSGYLGEKFAKDNPLTLSANIAFEQLYSGIEGDSASSTELYALLSSISGVPIKQSIAVTGSVNQRGKIQPIGGINEKIEGYFKVCKIKGLNGKQGVMMPHQNVKNLMLNEEVIQAVKAGMFNIYAVETIEDGIELLTGVKAGKMNEDGSYEEGSVYGLVYKKLKAYSKPIKNGKDKEKEE